MTVVSLTGVVSAAIAGNVTISKRTNLHLTHMLGAAAFAHEAGDIQNRNAGQPHSDFNERIVILANVTVMTAVASVEAYLNGIFEEGSQHFTPEMLPIFQQAAKDIEKMGALDKADWLLLLRGRSRLNRGEGSPQQLITLIKLRNALIHYRPEWDHEDKTHAELSKQLSGLFVPNPCFINDRLWFPHKWAGHAGASWAVRTGVDFLDHVAQLAGLPEPFGSDYAARLQTG